MNLNFSEIKPKQAIRKYYENPNDHFLYGKNDHSSYITDPKLSNIFSLEERTSAEMRKKQKEAREAGEIIPFLL